ncbi:MAG TPA: hypothetical protein VGN18_16260 [Jatrophihabitans sp.]|uniref:hypothetical protein n=1 Tax=Jatrophihabitans sp. TaxID=1932789 RepID=UPI002DFDBF61|nr:hypothetical protein [Jatrophihabitans sp.]
MMTMNRTKLIFAVGTTAALVAGCSSSKTTSSTSSTPALPAQSSTSPAAGVTSAPPASVTAPTSPTRSPRPVNGPVLSGSWKGTYGGAYTGTFVLQWTQSTSKLTGTINLSTAPGAMTINGSVAGGRIQFGTVGSQAITYTGSVSGSSMSGQYKIAGGAGGSGTWSATRG